MRWQFVHNFAFSAEASLLPQGYEGQLFVLSYF